MKTNLFCLIVLNTIFTCSLKASCGNLTVNWDSKPCSKKSIIKSNCDNAGYGTLYYDWSMDIPSDAAPNAVAYRLSTIKVEIEINGNTTLLSTGVGGKQTSNTHVFNRSGWDLITAYEETKNAIIKVSYDLQRFKWEKISSVSGNDEYDWVHKSTDSKTLESDSYELTHIKLPLVFNSNLNGNGNSNNFTEICDNDDLVLVSTSDCEDEYNIKINQIDLNNNFIGNVYDQTFSGQIPSTLNITNLLFPTVLASEFKYEIRVKLSNSDGSEEDVHRIYLKDTKFPAIWATTGTTLCEGEQTTITVNDPPNSFNWVSSIGGPFSGNPSTITVSNSGTVDISYNETCVETVYPLSFTVHPNPVLDLTNNDLDICLNEPNPYAPIQLNASPTGGTWTSLSAGHTISSSGYYDPTQGFTPFSSGTEITAEYTYSNLQGCTSTDQITFGYYDPPVLSPTVNDISCNGANDGVVYLNTSGGYYPHILEWNNQTSSFPVSNVTPNTHTVGATNNKGCKSTQTVTMVEPPAINAALNINSPYQVDCNGSSAIVTVNASGGTGVLSYDFGSGYSQSSTDLLTAGTYSIQVKDQDNCTLNTPLGLTVTEPSAISIPTPQVTDAQCLGQNTGVITIAPSGGTGTLSALWNDGQSTYTASNLTGGNNYSVTVTDANGCTKTESNIPVNNGSSGFTVSGTVTDESCLTAQDGEITASASTSATFNWGATQSATLSGLSGGNYTVTATEGNGCQVVETFAVNTDQDKWPAHTTQASGGSDNIVKVLADGQGNIYTLGEYYGNSNFAGIDLINNSNNTGVFIAKQDECGNVEWLRYTNLTTTGNPNIEAVDLELNGSGEPTFWISLLGDFSVSVNLIDDNQATLPIAYSVPLGEDLLEFSLTTSGAQSSTSNIPFDLNIDFIYDIEYNGTDRYLAGNFNGYAEIKEWDGNNLSSFAVNGNPTANYYTELEWNGNALYAGLNMDQAATLPTLPNSTNINNTNISNCVLVEFNNMGSVQNYTDARADEGSITDIELDGNGNIWVSTNFSQNLVGWGNVYSAIPTGGIFVFDNNLDLDMQQFLQDGFGQMNSANISALAYNNNTMFAAGSFQGINAEWLQDGSITYPAINTGSHTTQTIWLGSIESNGYVSGLDVAQSTQDMSSNDIAAYNDNAYTVGQYQAQATLGATLSLPYAGNGVSAFVARGGVNGAPTSYYKMAQESTHTEELNSGLTTEELPILAKVFPNPNEGIFTIALNRLPESSEQIAFTLMDVTGKIVLQEERSTNNGLQYTINASQFSKGIYFMHLNTQDFKQSIKVQVH